MWITEIISQMALDASDELRSHSQEPLLLTKLCMMSDRAAILQGNLITHFIVHCGHLLEKFLINLNAIAICQT